MINLFQDFHAFADRIRSESGEPDITVGLALDRDDVVVRVFFDNVPDMSHKAPIQVRMRDYDPSAPLYDVGQAGAALVEGVVRDLGYERDQKRKSERAANRIAETRQAQPPVDGSKSLGRNSTT